MSFLYGVALGLLVVAAGLRVASWCWPRKGWRWDELNWDYGIGYLWCGRVDPEVYVDQAYKEYLASPPAWSIMPELAGRVENCVQYGTDSGKTWSLYEHEPSDPECAAVEGTGRRLGQEEEG